MITSVLIAVSLNHALLIERNIVANYRGEPFDENVVYRTKKINNASNLKVSAIHQSTVEIICFFFFFLPTTSRVRQPNTRQITHSPVTRRITQMFNHSKMMYGP